MPHLFVVSINGADHEGDWDRLIQTLDRGEYDVFALLSLLKKLGYDGPIGLQCYNIQGDIRENLTRSIGAWKGVQGTRCEREQVPGTPARSRTRCASATGTTARTAGDAT